MQFELPGKKEVNTLYSYDRENRHVLQSFQPTRVFTNYSTNWNPRKAKLDPLKAVDKFQKLRQKKYERLRELEEIEHSKSARESRLDHEVICRLMRAEPQITAIRERSLAAGNRYGLEVELYGFIDQIGKDGGDINFFIPLFFIPGATTEDYETLALFSMKHQLPDYKQARAYLKNGVFNETICNRYLDGLKK